MICKNCGREIADTSKFCGYCGNKVEVSTPESIIFPDVNDKVIKPTNFDAPTTPDYSWISETAPKPVYEAPKPVEPVYEAPKPVEPVYENSSFTQPLQQANTTSSFAFEKPESNPISAYEGFNINSGSVQEPEEEVDMTPFSDVNNVSNLQQPVYEAPKPVEPVVQQSVYETLKPAEPVAQQPVYEAPKPVEPVVQQPVYETLKPVETNPTPEKNNESLNSNDQKLEKSVKKETNKKDFTSFIIVFLIIVIIMLSGFITWDKFINKETAIDNNVNKNTTNMTEKDASDIALDKYNSIYGDNFKLIYDSVLAGDTTNAKSLFTEECIEKMKNDPSYVKGIFGTDNQTKRDLTVISYGDEYIIAKGKNSSDTTSYYLTLRKIDGMWYIDMYE